MRVASAISAVAGSAADAARDGTAPRIETMPPAESQAANRRVGPKQAVDVSKGEAQRKGRRQRMASGPIALQLSEVNEDIQSAK